MYQGKFSQGPAPSRSAGAICFGLPLMFPGLCSQRLFGLQHQSQPISRGLPRADGIEKLASDTDSGNNKTMHI